MTFDGIREVLILFVELFTFESFIFELSMPAVYVAIEIYMVSARPF